MVSKYPLHVNLPGKLGHLDNKGTFRLVKGVLNTQVLLQHYCGVHVHSSGPWHN